MFEKDLSDNLFKCYFSFFDLEATALKERRFDSFCLDLNFRNCHFHIDF